MRRLTPALIAALLCAALAACHDEGHRQFLLPIADRAAAVAEVQRIAVEYKLLDSCMPKTNTPDALVCSWIGGGGGATGVLVREVDGRIVVDVGFKTAYVEGGMFDRLADELRTGLTRACGAADVTEPPPGQQVPVPRFI